MTSIGEKAFFNWAELPKITIPGSVTSIGYESFGYYYDYKGDSQKVENFKISGYKNSEAETYATNNEFKFHSLGKFKQTTDSSSSTESNSGITVLIVIVVLCLIGGAVLVILKHKKLAFFKDK